jgi:hypothetical protein
MTALDATTGALRRDACGDYAIIGKDGHIYADGAGYLLCVSTDESARRWGFVKKRLAFCQLRQDGDDEGALHLDRLPTPAEAEAIREAMSIPQAPRPVTGSQSQRAVSIGARQGLL